MTNMWKIFFFSFFSETKLHEIELLEQSNNFPKYRSLVYISFLCEMEYLWVNLQINLIILSVFSNPMGL